MENTLCILIGINYKGTKHELKGCINDVKLMENFFIKYLNIKKKNIIILTDDTKIKPTKFNIINQIKFNINKLNNNKKYKNLWIHYSGHGYKLKDKNKDELDLNDEIICTLPSNNNDCNYIVDDELNNLFSLINSDKNLFCIFDCCHSGTILDLKYKYNYIDNKFIINNINNKIKCNAILFSGCKDYQKSADVKNLGLIYKNTGAFTYAILNCFKINNSLSYLNILKNANKYLKLKGFKQIPQCSTSKKIDPKKNFFQSKILDLYKQKIDIQIHLLNKCLYNYNLSKDIKWKYKAENICNIIRNIYNGCA